MKINFYKEDTDNGKIKLIIIVCVYVENYNGAKIKSMRKSCLRRTSVLELINTGIENLLVSIIERGLSEHNCNERKTEFRNFFLFFHQQKIVIPRIW